MMQGWFDEGVWSAIVVQNFQAGAIQGQIDRQPDRCPLCHHLVIAVTQYGKYCTYNGKTHHQLELVYSCPNIECGGLFIAYFDPPPSAANRVYIYRESKPTIIKARDFDELVKQMSPAFCDIFNEAAAAESLELKQICGAGYRKALEFLIKDYLIGQTPDLSASIAKAQLGSCIDTYISDQRIKDVAKRAVWLGNDETHYERRWLEKDLHDLKQLIELTLHWIQMEILTISALASMRSVSGPSG